MFQARPPSRHANFSGWFFRMKSGIDLTADPFISIGVWFVWYRKIIKISNYTGPDNIFSVQCLKINTGKIPRTHQQQNRIFPGTRLQITFQILLCR